MKQELRGAHLETYREEWRHFLMVHTPVTMVIVALLVVAANEIMSCELSWATLGIIWALIVIFPLAWKLPPAPSLERDQ